MCLEFCKGCRDFLNVTDDLFLCTPCEEKLERDLIRKKRFDLSKLTVTESAERRKEIRKELMRVHGSFCEITKQNPELVDKYKDSRQIEIIKKSFFDNLSKKTIVRIKSFAATIYLAFREKQNEPPDTSELNQVAKLLSEKTKKENIGVPLNQCLSYIEVNKDKLEASFKKMVKKKRRRLIGTIQQN